MKAPIIGSQVVASNGQFYTVKAIANTAGAPTLTPVTVIYENDNGDTFTRPLRSWDNAMTSA